MNGKQSKKLRAIAVMFHKSQPQNMSNSQSLESIYKHLKSIHTNGKIKKAQPIK